MSEHTEGLLTAENGDGYSIWSLWIGKQLVAQVIGDSPETDANAARLVACWNACRGIETADLEAIPPGSIKDALTGFGLTLARADAAEALLRKAVGHWGPDPFEPVNPSDDFSIEVRDFLAARAAPPVTTGDEGEG